MKIMLVVPAYRPSFYTEGKGGGEISNQVLLDSLAEGGDRVYVVSMSAVVNSSIYYDGRIVVIEPFANLKNGRLSKILSMVFFKNSLLSIIRKVGPDVVLSSTSVVKVVADVCRLDGVKHGAIVRAMENMPGYGWKLNPLSINSVFKFIFHKVTIGWPGGRELDKVDFIVTNSCFMKHKYSEYFPDKPIHINYPSLAIEKSSNPVPDSVNRVMMVGTSPAKGFDTFKKLSGSFPQLEFHAIGDAEVPVGETLRIGNLHLHGWMKDPVPFIDKMDLVLVPSRWEEPFGRIAVEGIYRNKFVLVSGKGGLPEAVNYNKDMIVSSDDYESWEKALASLVNNVDAHRDDYLSWLSGFENHCAIAQAGNLRSFFSGIL